MTLTLALVESALQLVPIEIQSHHQIKAFAERRQKQPSEILLDRAFHNAAMQKLAQMGGLRVERMGRPDIVHNTLLQILETPLNWEGGLRTFVHTQDDFVISVNPKVRLPKNYVRFVGLIEQLFEERRVPGIGEPLLSIERMSLPQLIAKCNPSRATAFSVLGKPRLLRDVAEDAAKLRDPMVLIGGFPRGHFTDRTLKSASGLVKVDVRSLDAWVVAGRFVYDFEWSIGLAESRLKQIRSK